MTDLTEQSLESKLREIGNSGIINLSPTKIIFYPSSIRILAGIYGMSYDEMFDCLESLAQKSGGSVD